MLNYIWSRSLTLQFLETLRFLSAIGKYAVGKKLDGKYAARQNYVKTINSALEDGNGGVLYLHIMELDDDHKGVEPGMSAHAEGVCIEHMNELGRGSPELEYYLNKSTTTSRIIEAKRDVFNYDYYKDKSLKAARERNSRCLQIERNNLDKLVELIQDNNQFKSCLRIYKNHIDNIVNGSSKNDLLKNISGTVFVRSGFILDNSNFEAIVKELKKINQDFPVTKKIIVL